MCVCVGRLGLKLEGKYIAESACRAPFTCIVEQFYHRERFMSRGIWGMGSREWGVGLLFGGGAWEQQTLTLPLFPTPHSPFPYPVISRERLLGAFQNLLMTLMSLRGAELRTALRRY